MKRKCPLIGIADNCELLPIVVLLDNLVFVVFGAAMVVPNP
jgi:hypothetical protein